MWLISLGIRTLLIVTISGATAWKGVCEFQTLTLSRSSSDHQETLVGIIGDVACGRKHSLMPKKSDAECTRTCVRRLGSRYALVDATKIYVLDGDEDEVDSHAGEKAKVTGVISGDTIIVSAVAKE